MIVDRIERDAAKLTSRLKSPLIVAGLAQLDDIAAEHLVLGVMDEISPDFILDGIQFDRPKSVTIIWSHKSGGGEQSTSVNLLD